MESDEDELLVQALDEVEQWLAVPVDDENLHVTKEQTTWLRILGEFLSQQKVYCEHTQGQWRTLLCACYRHRSWPAPGRFEQQGAGQVDQKVSTASQQSRYDSLGRNRTPAGSYGSPGSSHFNFQLHQTKTLSGKACGPNQSSVCDSWHKCANCRKLLCSMNEQDKHWRRYSECPSCHETTNLNQHQCFVQIPTDP